MTELPNIIYLHGLGSSPQSTKARLVQGYFEEHGFVVRLPSLALPSFERLSVVEVISFVGDTLRRCGANREVIIIGSSFGGFVATHALHHLSERDRSCVKGLVLLAPVFYPWHPQYGLINSDVEKRWKQQGTFPLPEGEQNKMTQVHFGFVEELRLYDTDKVKITTPTLIIHGKQDDTVSFQQSVEFGARHSNVDVCLIDDNHQLTADAQALLSTIHHFIDRLL